MEKKFFLLCADFRDLLLSLVSVAHSPGQSPEVSQARPWPVQWCGLSWGLLLRYARCTCGAEWMLRYIRQGFLLATLVGNTNCRVTILYPVVRLMSAPCLLLHALELLEKLAPLDCPFLPGLQPIWSIEGCGRRWGSTREPAFNAPIL